MSRTGKATSLLHDAGVKCADRPLKMPREAVSIPQEKRCVTAPWTCPSSLSCAAVRIFSAKYAGLEVLKQDQWLLDIGE
jgi:hypothetical protein